ncbi:hypothetical protein HGM15179_006554 [Zosterops borbonicus]|uniref:Uncharacterized protein n=1 Tax=Zosterops borbonicus TaxID=364589 RepID=A0A8K1GMC1_9PASS|nr:hypothetical protein HGM15179_006554 [Zosterops borbonicus]
MESRRDGDTERRRDLECLKRSVFKGEKEHVGLQNMGTNDRNSGLWRRPQVPEEWRKINVTPIFKKSKKEDPENYRPVNLTFTLVSCLTLWVASLSMWRKRSSGVVNLDS